MIFRAHMNNFFVAKVKMSFLTEMIIHASSLSSPSMLIIKARMINKSQPHNPIYS